MNFVLYVISFAMCICNCLSFSLGPSLEDLENKNCPSHKPLLCIPYGACCAYSEFCHAGLCESCFYDRVLANLLEWCRELGQYNVSLMRSSSCRFACQDRFTPQDLMVTKTAEMQQVKEKNDLASQDQRNKSASNETLILPTFVLALIIFIMLIVVVVPKVWQQIYKLKIKLQRNAFDTGSVPSPSSNDGTTQIVTLDKLQVKQEEISKLAPNKNSNINNNNSTPVTDTALSSIHVVENNTNVLTRADMMDDLVDLAKEARGSSGLQTNDRKNCIDDDVMGKLQVTMCETEESVPLLQNDPEGGGKMKQEDYKVIIHVPGLSTKDLTTEELAVEERRSESPRTKNRANGVSYTAYQPTKRRASLGFSLGDVPENNATNTTGEGDIHIHPDVALKMDETTRGFGSSDFLNGPSDITGSNDEEHLVSSLGSSSKDIYCNFPTIDKAKMTRPRHQSAS